MSPTQHQEEKEGKKNKQKLPTSFVSLNCKKQHWVNLQALPSVSRHFNEAPFVATTIISWPKNWKKKRKKGKNGSSCFTWLSCQVYMIVFGSIFLSNCIMLCINLKEIFLPVLPGMKRSTWVTTGMTLKPLLYDVISSTKHQCNSQFSKSRWNYLESSENNQGKTGFLWIQ